MKVVDVVNNPIGIYGWKKYFLYLSVLLLTCLAIINIGLAVFLMKVLDINSSGAGIVRFDSGILRVDGVAELTQGIYANNVTSFDENSLSLLSTKQIVLQANTSSSLTLSDGLVDMRVDTVRAIYNNQPYFTASPDTITLAATKTKVTSASGMVVDGSVQVSQITNMHAGGQGLTIESIAQQLTVQAAKDVNIATSDGAMTLSALSSLSLTSQSKIALSAPRIILANLPSFGSEPFALCACGSGRLFRVSALNASLTCASVSSSVCP